MMLREYQFEAADWIVDQLFVRDRLGCMLWVDCGLGKTLITLSADRRLRRLGLVKRTMVVTYPRVARSTWPAEIRKWGFELRTKVLEGDPKAMALALADPQIQLYTISFDRLPWLSQQTGWPPCDLLIVDEITALKNWSSQRVKAFRLKKGTVRRGQGDGTPKGEALMGKFKKRIGMTGTPVPNSEIELHPQYYVIDGGQRLGRTQAFFHATYCWGQSSAMGKDYVLKNGAAQAIQEAVRPITYRLDEKDHLDLPPMVINDIWVDLPARIMTEYKRLERELFLALDQLTEAQGEDREVIAQSAVAKYLICRQLANGGVYVGEDEAREAVHVHDTKTDVVQEIVHEANGKPVLVAYNFRHDLDRLRKAFPEARMINGDTSTSETDDTLRDWNEGKIQVLLCQCQSISHGLNMQGRSTDCVWYGLTDRPETYAQLNKRLHRLGVKGQVRIHRILASRTVDERIRLRIDNKAERQKSILQSLRDYQRKANL